MQGPRKCKDHGMTVYEACKSQIFVKSIGFEAEVVVKNQVIHDGTRDHPALAQTPSRVESRP
jgi:hypothetical protein